MSPIAKTSTADAVAAPTAGGARAELTRRTRRAKLARKTDAPAEGARLEPACDTALSILDARRSGAGVMASPRSRQHGPSIASDETSVRLTFAVDVPRSALVMIAPPPALVGPRNADHMGMSRRELLEVLRDMRADTEFAGRVTARSRKNPQAAPDDVRAFLRARYAATPRDSREASSLGAGMPPPSAHRRRRGATQVSATSENDAVVPSATDVLRELGFRPSARALRRPRP